MADSLAQIKIPKVSYRGGSVVAVPTVAQRHISAPKSFSSSIIPTPSSKLVFGSGQAPVTLKTSSPVATQVQHTKNTVTAQSLAAAPQTISVTQTATAKSVGFLEAMGNSISRTFRKVTVALASMVNVQAWAERIFGNFGTTARKLTEGAAGSFAKNFNVGTLAPQAV